MTSHAWPWKSTWGQWQVTPCVVQSASNSLKNDQPCQTTHNSRPAASCPLSPWAPVRRRQAHRPPCTRARCLRPAPSARSGWWWLDLSPADFWLPPKALKKKSGKVSNKAMSLTLDTAEKVTMATNSLVFPFSPSSGPSPSAYTGNTVTVYSVFGSRFFSSRVVVLSDTCSCWRDGRVVTERHEAVPATYQQLQNISWCVTSSRMEDITTIYFFWERNAHQVKG